MTRTMLAAAMALTLMSGAAVAQSSSSSSTTESTTATPVVRGDMTTTTHNATDAGGMLTEKDKTVSKSSDISPSGDTTISRNKSETTTVR